VNILTAPCAGLDSRLNSRRASHSSSYESPPVPQKEGPRTNREIRVREVQLIDAEGQNRGVVDIVEP